SLRRAAGGRAARATAARRRRLGGAPLGARRVDLTSRQPAPALGQLRSRDDVQIAFDLSMKKDYLPEEARPDPDKQNYYLHPYIQQVKQEEAERKAYHH